MPRKMLIWLFLPVVLVIGFYLFMGFVFLHALHTPRTPESHARSDMRSIATALESYYVDNNTYPAWTLNRETSINSNRKAWDSRLERQPTFMILTHERPGLATLTTPVSYLTNFFYDPFGPCKKTVFSYFSVNGADNAGWIVWSAGPDRDYDLSIDNIPNICDPADTTATLRRLNLHTYNPTNGSISKGDIWHVKS